MKLFPRSLTTRLLILFLLLAILPLLVVGYLAFDLGRQSIVSNVEAHLESVAILKEHEIQNWVNHLEHTITWMAASPTIAGDAVTLATHTAGDPGYLAAHDSLVAEFRRITVLGHLSPVFLLDSANGQIMASSDTSWEGRFRRTEPWFIEGKTSITVSDMFHSLALGRPTMVIAAPVTGSDGQLLGVLAGHANLEDLSQIMLERSGLGKTGETFLVNRSNLLLTSTEFAPDGAFKKWIFGQGAERALRGESGIGLFMDYREQPVIGAYRWLEDSKLALIAKQDQAEAFAPVAVLRNAVLGIGFGVALAVALLGLVFARTITRSVHQLVVGAGEIGRGNLDYRIEVATQDEIGQLSRAFNQMAQDLQDAQEQLVRREKLAVLGQMAGGVAHELRNPLGVISNAAYYLEMVNPDADETTKEYLDMISSEVHNADRIISDLLDHSRTQLADRERIAISELVATGVEKHPPPEGVQVTTQIAADLPPAYADPHQIGLVLGNLVTNAYQAMPDGGNLTISAARSGRPEVSISITDTGCGISAENMEKVFEPLFTTKARGIGLGLSVSRTLVDANGGTIEVESEEGEGSTFTVTLPTKEALS